MPSGPLEVPADWNYNAVPSTSDCLGGIRERLLPKPTRFLVAIDNLGRDH
jgi:hypothetical protein